MKAIVVGYVHEILKPYLYNTITESNRIKVYINESDYNPEEIPFHQYLTLIMGFSYEDITNEVEDEEPTNYRHYFYYKNSKVPNIYDYRPIFEEVFKSEMLDIYAHVVQSKDVDWPATIARFKEIGVTSLDYVDRSAWYKRVHIAEVEILINASSHLNRMINYVEVDVL